MKPLKASLIPFLRRFSKTASLPMLVRLSGKNLFCPFYHTIAEKPLPHIRHLYKVRTPDQFRADIDYFLKHFEPLNYNDLKEFVTNSKRTGKPHFFLSFDDGLKEVYEIAAPILVEKGLPAMVFLNSDFVDNRGLMFRYKASLLIEKLSGLSSEKIMAIAKLLGTGQDVEKIKIRIMEMGYPDQGLIDQAGSVSETDFQGYLDTEQPYLTSEQIRSMSDSGLFTFASHSIDHPLYKDLDLERQLTQTQSSLEWLSARKYNTQKAFAFPFTDDGVEPEFFETIFKNRVLDLSFGAAGLKEEEFEGRHIQRFPMEGTDLPASQLVPAEYIYFLLKRLVGRGNVRR